MKIYDSLVTASLSERLSDIAREEYKWVCKFVKRDNIDVLADCMEGDYRAGLLFWHCEHCSGMRVCVHMLRVY